MLAGKNGSGLRILKNVAGMVKGFVEEFGLGVELHNIRKSERRC